ncbi:MAG TPA: hypothetical protein DEP47_07345 [Chloroflexi bacterium]|nr:hypothetical protein [Chloroflexota bacterium]
MIPIIGLGLAAAAFFLFGGINLIILLFVSVAVGLGLMEAEAHAEEIPIIIEVVEHVHQFLIGTVLYITAIGFYQLFIKEIEFPGWLKIDSTEELETALVGVTVVVLAVNFLAQVFAGENINILAQGAGIAMPIAALGIFIGLRAWASRQDREVAESKRRQSSRSKSTED